MPARSPASFQNDIRSPGARVAGDGVHYSVWAADHQQLSLAVTRRDGSQLTDQMHRDADSYFSLHDPTGAAGDRYQFVFADGTRRPDPASRFQPAGVHAASECIDPNSYVWRAKQWQRPGWRGQSIYEIHVGTFTPEGTFLSAIEKLDHLVDLGVQAIEIMPIADFPGDRNWGYDGVALFAPARCYGRPDDFRTLVDAAHEHGLTVILDVVYNHLGPDGNYLSQFSSSYFHPDRHTPWGQAFHLSGPGSKPARTLFTSNVAYWFDEFRVDGLRLDATHAIEDDSAKHLLEELREIAHARGAFLIAEDERNSCEILRHPDGTGAGLDGAWADDFHHQVRVALTSAQDSYYKSYRGTAEEIAQTLANGWFFIGQPYPFWKGRPKGEPSRHLPTKTFVYCIENHDQVGNRALGERLEHLVDADAFRAASALLCLSPYPPLIFMGQEWGASSPFLFFTDHAAALGAKISEGRQKEFSAAGLNRHLAPEDVPDPQASQTFLRSKLNWLEAHGGVHAGHLELYRDCLRQRSSWLHDETVDRANWKVGAIANAVAIRYEAAGRPMRLVVCALKSVGRISLGDQPLLRAPEGSEWRLEIETGPTALDLSGEAIASVATTWAGPAAVVATLRFDRPATVLLIAIPTRTGDRQ